MPGSPLTTDGPVGVTGYRMGAGPAPRTAAYHPAAAERGPLQPHTETG
jgi:hypothetical protein